MIKIRSICKIDGCYNFVDTEPDRAMGSKLTRAEVNGHDMMIAMYPSKECSHGLCYYHAMRQWFEKQEPGREVDRL